MKKYVTDLQAKVPWYIMPIYWWARYRTIKDLKLDSKGSAKVDDQLSAKSLRQLREIEDKVIDWQVQQSIYFNNMTPTEHYMALVEGTAKDNETMEAFLVRVSKKMQGKKLTKEDRKKIGEYNNWI